MYCFVIILMFVKVTYIWFAGVEEDQERLETDESMV